MAVHSKRARGLMARYVMEHRIHEIIILEIFAEDYQYSEAESSEDRLVFIR